MKMWRNLEIKKRHKLMMMMIEDQETFVHIMVTIKEIRDMWDKVLNIQSLRIKRKMILTKLL